jgi:hypothetical protein
MLWFGLGLEAPGFGFTFLKPMPKLSMRAWLWLKPQLASKFPQCICYTFFVALLLPMQKMQLDVHIVVWVTIIRVLF